MVLALSPPPTPTDQAGLRALRALIKHRNILSSLTALHQEMGDVFQLTLPGFKPVFLVGPEALRFVLVEARKGLLWRQEGDPVTDLLRHGVLVEDGESHDQLRRSMNPALHRKRIEGYVEDMVACTDQILDTWTDSQPRDMLVEMRKIALLILVKTLFNVGFYQHMKPLWHAILRNLEYISPGLWLVWPGAPRLGYRRARKRLDNYLFQLITARREMDGPKDDLLGQLISSPNMSDDLIRDQLLTMLIAGHDTSTAFLTWALFLLGRHSDVMDRLENEIRCVLGTDETPTYENTKSMGFLDQVIKETLRLYPPIHLGARIAATDLEFKGFEIPAGTRVVYSIYLTHRQERHWPDPESFEPDRFSAQGNKTIAPYTYAPFGGGPRNCIGFAFAMVESRVVLARILQKFRLKLLKNRVHAHMGATLEPRPGVMMFPEIRRIV